MTDRLLRMLFPPKCILCKTLLTEEETDLCHHCREHAPVFSKEKINFSFIAGWTAVWYYKDTVRKGLLQYKFYGRRSSAAGFARALAMKLHREDMNHPDVLVWVPISRRRKFTRGYDQVELIAKALSAELDISAVGALKKIRHTPPQSSLKTAAQRRANVLGAYRVISPESVAGKNVLLIDDVITTGATASECARVLTMAGAAKVTCAAVAAAPHDKKENQ